MEDVSIQICPICKGVKSAECNYCEGDGVIIAEEFDESAFEIEQMLYDPYIEDEEDDF